MKKYLAMAATLLSMNVFAQSYLILNNGVTLTTDKAGFIYDFGNFHIPYKITLNGGQFLAEEKNLLTVDSQGFLYNKDKKVDKVKGKGMNYLINDDKLVTIDAKGFFYEFEDKIFKKVTAFGGNFFLVKPDDKKAIVDLYTVNLTGNYSKLNIPGLNPLDIVTLGGTFFQTRAGVTYTISKDGLVFSKADQKVGAVKKAGGNFFVDAAGLLFTVSEEGFLMLPVLPTNIKVADIQKVGANYMIDSEGRIFIVDKVGNLVERTINHDLRNAKILSI